jgi:hypothetical protein
MSRIVALACVLALGLVSTGCEEGSRAVPAPITAPEACEPMPTECPSPMACEVTVAEDGTRVCTGEACCVSFCEANGCGRCCK